MFYRKELVVDSRNYQFWYVNIKIQASSFELKIPFMRMRWLKSEMNFITQAGQLFLLTIQEQVSMKMTPLH